VLFRSDGDERWHLMEESNLGAAEVLDGRRARRLQTHGSVFHKAEWTVRLPAGFAAESLRLQAHYQGEDPVDVRVMLTDRRVLVRGEVRPASGWQEIEIHRASAEHDESDVLKQVDYGTGAIRIMGIEFLDADGRNVAQISYGAPMTVRIRCHAVAPVPDQAVTFCVGFARQGFTHQAYIYDANLAIPEVGEFVIDSVLDEVRLGSGLWYVNVGIGAAGIFLRDEIPYFSVDSGWYHLLSGRLQFRVLSVTKFDAGGCFYAIPAQIAAVPALPSDPP
jgi:hypothetical protein